MGWTFRGSLRLKRIEGAKSWTLKPFLFIVLLGLTLPTFSDETPADKALQGDGELSLPWAAFEKLKLTKTTSF